jgi:P27 family predicted phage terminase small subunit
VVAAAKWDELVAIIETEGRITKSDGPWLEVTSEAYAEYIRWREEAQAAPLIHERDVFDKLGTLIGTDIKAHPAQQQHRLSWETYRKLLAEGGLTPSSRARAAVPRGTGEAADPFDEFDTTTPALPAPFRVVQGGKSGTKTSKRKPTTGAAKRKTAKRRPAPRARK